jgi:hypothetical protein
MLPWIAEAGDQGFADLVRSVPHGQPKPSWKKEPS